jgi:hypothetical protein
MGEEGWERVGGEGEKRHGHITQCNHLKAFASTT